MTDFDTRPWQAGAMITSRISIPETEVQHAARRLVTLFGLAARTEAAERADQLARQSRWPEHDVALRILTAVEVLAEGGTA